MTFSAKANHLHTRRAGGSRRDRLWNTSVVFLAHSKVSRALAAARRRLSADLFWASVPAGQTRPADDVGTFAVRSDVDDFLAARVASRADASVAILADDCLSVAFFSCGGRLRADAVRAGARARESVPAHVVPVGTLPAEGDDLPAK